MPTSGQAKYFNANVGTLIGLVFIASYTLGVGLILWHAIFLSNPLADIFAQQIQTNAQLLQK